jgi:hypothetical protein
VRTWKESREMLHHVVRGYVVALRTLAVAVPSMIVLCFVGAGVFALGQSFYGFARAAVLVFGEFLIISAAILFLGVTIGVWWMVLKFERITPEHKN